MITRRGIAAFGVFLAGVTAGGALMAQSAASAFSTGYGGGEVSCIVIPYSYPQYGISGTVTYCGGGWHEGGPRQ
jgi:hypothetical protein